MNRSSSSTKESMEIGSRRSSSSRGSGPKAGSVWETRMKLDQTKGGIKILDHVSPLSNPQNPMLDKKGNSKSNNNEIKTKQSPTVGGSTGKRKTWKPDNNSEGINPVQIARQRSESSKNLDQLFKETTACPDGFKRPESVEEGKGESQPSIGNSIQISQVDEANTALEAPSCSRSDEDEVCQEKRAITTNVCQIIKAGQTVGLGVDREIEIVKKRRDVEEIRQRSDNKRNTTAVEEIKPVRVPIPPLIKKQPARLHPIPTKTRPNDFHTRTNSRLQNFVDLVMWRDVSRSAFVFGVGTFAIVSSSFTKDLNISFISLVSYFGLVYLAANFLFRSLVSRGSMEMNGSDGEYVVGEEDAIWLVKLLLPHVNGFLVKLRALFSGDPAITLKLAVLLFVLARCGSSITIWKMAKLGFIVVFTVPKVCSSYSAHLSAHVTFWIRRFGDAWKSCSHKKAVGFAVLSLIWNMSSIVARVWMVFMLLVALKYCQQLSMRSNKWARGETVSAESSCQQGKCNGGQQWPGGRFAALAEAERQEKVSRPCAA